MKRLADFPVLRETSPLYNNKKSGIYPSATAGLIAAFLSAPVISSVVIIKEFGAITLNRIT
jgi:hypothetical protein